MRRLHLPLLIGLVAALALPAGARASTTQFTMFEAPRELLSGDPALRDRTIGEIQGLGAHWVRVVVYWHSVAPGADSATRPSFAETDPAAYDWSRYDSAIQALRAHGVRVLLTVSGPVPRWATHDRDDTVTKPSPTRFRRFMQAVGTHYGKDVGYWSIWNEPNHPDFLMPQYVVSRGHRTPVSPALYRALFQQGVKGLRASAGNAHDRVLMGETAPVGTTRVAAHLRPRRHVPRQRLPQAPGLRDDTSRPGPAKDRYAGFESGLRTSEGEPKLSYDAFRLPLVARKVSRQTVSLWGLVRPQHSKRQHVTIGYRTRGSSTWHRLKADTTNSRGYWSTTSRYRSGATYRVRWNGVSGPSTPVTSYG